MNEGEREGQCWGHTQHHLEGMPCQGLPSFFPGKEKLRPTSKPNRMTPWDQAGPSGLPRPLVLFITPAVTTVFSLKHRMGEAQTWPS